MAEPKETTGTTETGTKKPGKTNEIEVTEDDLKDVSGGLVPQPLPPKKPPPGDQRS
jgi:hypothetical protein